MYDFDKAVDRRGTTSIKWNKQYGFGQKDGLLPFWIADTDFATVPEIMTAVQERCGHPIIGYSEPLDSVYTAVQGWWERRHHWRPETDWMLLSYGVVTGIYFTLNALIPKEEKVLVFTPVYDPFFAAVKNSGHTLVECPLDYEANHYSIDFKLLKENFKNGVKAVVFCNPHNPVGRVWSYEEMEKLTSLCAEYGVYLLSDEIHADFGLTHPYTPAGMFESIHDKLVVYTAISKTFNMAGLGSSCIIVPNKEAHQKISASYDACWMFGPSDLAFTAIEAAYSYGDQWVDEQAEYLRGNVKAVRDFVGLHMPLVQVTEHEGTFLMWLNMNCLKLGSGEITAVLAKEFGLALGDGSHYGKQADGFMRLNIGCTRKTLMEGLEKMAEMYDKYMNL